MAESILTPTRSPEEKSLVLLDRLWTGTLSGKLSDLDLTWKVAFHFETIGHVIAGSGYIAGDGTYDESLEFCLTGNDQVDPTTNQRTLVIAVLEPLPKHQKAFMHFDFENIHLTKTALNATWRLACMYPKDCGCAGGNGLFSASKN